MPENTSAEEIIDRLGLVAHPEEGGFFRETYRSAADFEPGSPFAGRMARPSTTS